MKSRHSDHAIGHKDRFVQFVGNDQDGVLGSFARAFHFKVFLVETQKHELKFLSHRFIECTEGFVEQYDFGFQDEGLG